MACNGDGSPSKFISCFLNRHLNSNTWPGLLEWVDANKRIGTISWSHGGKKEKDIYEAWHRVKNSRGTSPVPKLSKLKHNFDMAIKNGSGVQYLGNGDLETVLSELQVAPEPSFKYFRLGRVNYSFPSPQQTVLSPDSGIATVSESVPASVDQYQVPSVSSGASPGMNQASPEFNLSSPPGMDQATPGVFGMNQANPEFNLSSPGMDQATPGVFGMNQANPEFNLSSLGMDQPSTGVDSANTNTGIDDADVLMRAIQLAEIPQESPLAVQLAEIPQESPGEATTRWTRDSTFVPSPGMNTAPEPSEPAPHSITSSQDRFLKTMVYNPSQLPSLPSSSASPMDCRSLADTFSSMSISDKSFKDSDAVRTAQSEYNVRGCLIEYPEGVKYSDCPRLGDRTLPQNIDDRGNEFAVVVWCEGKLVIARMVVDSCLLTARHDCRERRRESRASGPIPVPLAPDDRDPLSLITNKVLKKCCDNTCTTDAAGLIIKCLDSGDLYATRKMAARPFCDVGWWRESLGLCNPFALGRDTETKIFDMNDFAKHLSQCIADPAVVIDIGDDSFNEHSKILVQVMSRKGQALYSEAKELNSMLQWYNNQGGEVLL